MTEVEKLYIKMLFEISDTLDTFGDVFTLVAVADKYFIPIEKYIEELEKENAELKDKTKWHKVADELPEEEGYYLVFDKGTRNIIIGMFADGKFESCFPVAWCEIPTLTEVPSECVNKQ